MIPWTPICLIGIAIVLWWYRQVCAIALQRTRFYAWNMRTWVAYGRISCCHADMNGEKYIAGCEQLKSGDVLLTTDKRAFSTLLVPGVHTHAALCLGYFNGHMMLAEMTNKGYCEVPVCLRWFQSSRVVIIRCTDWDYDYGELVVETCRSFAGTPYDNDFDLAPDRIYCSELIRHADLKRRMDVTFSRAPVTGQLTITPDDLLAASNVEVVYDSDEAIPCEPDSSQQWP